MSRCREGQVAETGPFKEVAEAEKKQTRSRGSRESIRQVVEAAERRQRKHRRNKGSRSQMRCCRVVRTVEEGHLIGDLERQSNEYAVEKLIEFNYTENSESI